LLLVAGFVFVSHSRQDGAYATRLVELLREARLRVWLATEDIATGYTFHKDVMRDQIDACAVMIVLMSPAAASAQYVRAELDRAEQQGKPILPVLLSGEPLLELTGRAYFDARDGRLPDDRFLRHLTELVTDSPGRSVFISYRRELSWALAHLVFNDLKGHGFDVFMDVESLDSGEFERVVLREIEARVHFVVVLAPGCLERIGEEGDWLRREIAHALAHDRNVVPLTVDGFKFRRDLMLAADVARLPGFNAVSIPPGYFDMAMERLRSRFLKSSPAGRG